MVLVECPLCRFQADIKTILRSVAGYDRNTRSGVSSCPQCHKAIEYRVTSGALHVGYTYSSGSLHFDSLFTVKASGLKCEITDQAVTFIYKGERYEVPAENK
ncbi:MAG: hypothetical protein EPN25_02485 [Nitrospirae bacterium]|nr:MAG: hypothetical protein EPN25_02485 [Nitrospirota bacterium]